MNKWIPCRTAIVVMWNSSLLPSSLQDNTIIRLELGLTQIFEAFEKNYKMSSWISNLNLNTCKNKSISIKYAGTVVKLFHIIFQLKTKFLQHSSIGRLRIYKMSSSLSNLNLNTCKNCKKTTFSKFFWVKP